MKTVTTQFKSRLRTVGLWTLGLWTLCASAGEIPLTFTYPAPPSDLGEFRLYHGPVGTGTTNMVIVPKTARTVTVTNLPPATYWFYLVTRTTNGIPSDPSNLVIASVPAAPTGLGIPPQP